MSHGQTRMTRQRALILEELRKLDTHPTADELHGIVRARLPRISLGTVYRNLDVLVDSGMARCLASVGAAKRFDGNISDHQHVRCVVCGRIGDIPAPRTSPAVVGLRAEGFASILGARVEYDGLCECCARTRDAQREAAATSPESEKEARHG